MKQKTKKGKPRGASFADVLASLGYEGTEET